jgi:hypothetical protein
MIILPLALGLMLAFLAWRFGRSGLARLATLRLRGGVLALLACLAQLTSVLTHQRRLELLLVSAALLAGFCWLNRRQAGITLATLGITLNMAVMAANGGTMPISPEALARMSDIRVESGTALRFSKDIVLTDGEAALAWLGDRLSLPGPLARLAVWSIGDVLLLVGVGRLLWHTMKGPAHDDEHALRGAAPLS